MNLSLRIGSYDIQKELGVDEFIRLTDAGPTGPVATKEIETSHWLDALTQSHLTVRLPPLR